MSVLVWIMIGVAIWHFAVLLPDKFTGGIIVAFLAAVAGALLSGYLLPAPGVSDRNPPGLAEAVWPIPGAVIGLALLYAHGARRDTDPDGREGLLATSAGCVHRAADSRGNPRRPATSRSHGARLVAAANRARAPVRRRRRRSRRAERRRRDHSARGSTRRGCARPSERPLQVMARVSAGGRCVADPMAPARVV
jgi:uncharacterized membrane protein YeaQ/YmgE (transglycosylase-associated protein family)